MDNLEVKLFMDLMNSKVIEAKRYDVVESI